MSVSVVSAGPAAAPRERTYEELERIFAGVDAPFAFVDLDAMWSNAREMLARAAGTPIRVASKSVRCRSLLGAILEQPGFTGLMTFTLPESLWLHRHGFDDLLVAYPTVDRSAIAELARLDSERPPIAMVDSTEQLDYMEAAIGSGVAAGAAIGGGTPGAASIGAGAPAGASIGGGEPGEAAIGGGTPGGAAASPSAPGTPARPAPRPIRVCLELDTGWWPLGGRLKVGAKRSPVRTPAQAQALAREVVARPRFELAAVMGYEAHIAGVGDRPLGRRLQGPLIRAMKRRSAAELAERRAAVVAAVREVAPVPIVNGGGTGSIHTTRGEEVITEITAGSGFFAPLLFDRYSDFTLTPAAMFAMPVVRRPSASIATLLGGGYLASGAAGPDRLPAPYLPRGLRLDPQEGAGEVQTPVIGAAAASLRIGDRVYLRHAKAGELCERFNGLHLVRGQEIVDEVPTYRGEGRAEL